ncbi:TraR/DksA C4-type zinc finger protein, partial [Pseudomonas aeruginosa]
GWCNQCGELIASGRLEFDPATPLCITCASRTESG